MKNRILPVLALAVLFAFALAASAGDAKTVMLSGNIVCAKCTLKKADAKECQSVLVTKEPAAEYYLVKNEVEKKAHVCSGEKPAMVTGTVEEKDGRMWLTASKIEAEPK